MMWFVLSALAIVVFLGAFVLREYHYQQVLSDIYEESNKSFEDAYWLYDKLLNRYEAACELLDRTTKERDDAHMLLELVLNQERKDVSKQMLLDEVF